MSAVTAPHDDVDTSNPNHHHIDTESPCRQLVMTPTSVSGGSELDSHMRTQFCKRVWRGVRWTARHYSAESWESEGSICIPKSTNYHNTLIYIFV